jgi:hypothetical protein
MRVFIGFVIAAIALGYAMKSTTSQSPTMASLLTVATPAATLSPHEIHLNYKAMKELPVHDSANAN